MPLGWNTNIFNVTVTVSPLSPWNPPNPALVLTVTSMERGPCISGALPSMVENTDQVAFRTVEGIITKAFGRILIKVGIWPNTPHDGRRAARIGTPFTIIAF